MRIIGSFNNPIEAQRFSAFLNIQHISHEVDVKSNTNWEDSQYGDRLCHIWIIDEDQTGVATDWFNRFKENPNDPIFPPLATPRIVLPADLRFGEKKPSTSQSIPWDRQPMGIITRAIIIICCALFAISQYLTPQISPNTPSIAYRSLLRTPVEKELMYDYPYHDEILDKVIRLYGVDKLSDPNELPYEGKYLLNQYERTPYWKGFYEVIINNFKLPLKDWTINAPLFEKIGQGEIWRLVTPIFLHADIFHIFFNMLWLLVLGKQLEQRMSAWKYILFIAIAAIFSNTSQYLMGGSSFLGFSGVLCAMLTFIWMRQRRAPWEGYQLEKATIGFMMVFIFAVASVQLLSFILELAGKGAISPGIANTAHLSGAAIGVILGSLDFFSWDVKDKVKPRSIE